MTPREQLRHSIGDWTRIRTGAHLGVALLSAANAIRRLGHDQLATEWERRIPDIPANLPEPTIHCILWEAWQELWHRDIFYFWPRLDIKHRIQYH